MPMSSDSEDVQESEECPREREKQIKGLEARKRENLLRRGWVTARLKAGHVVNLNQGDGKPLEIVNQGMTCLVCSWTDLPRC